MNHHTHDPVCPLCEEKLTLADPQLATWFRAVKARYANVHVSWSWRGEADQDAFFKEGKTRAQWPKSKHNNMQGGRPWSLALDLFQIDEDGVARFSPLFYAKLADENEKANEPILWGGMFHSIGDKDHFELRNA